MHITIAPRNILQIDEIDGRDLLFRNFEGRGDKFNREGDRNFSLRLSDPETANELVERGWNVKIKDGRDEDDGPFMRLPVKVKFGEYPPRVYLWTGDRRNELDEESVGILDQIEIESVNMDISGYNWEVNGRTGRTAYLQTIEVFQKVDRFQERYARMSKDEMLDI